MCAPAHVPSAVEEYTCVIPHTVVVCAGLHAAPAAAAGACGLWVKVAWEAGWWLGGQAGAYLPYAVCADVLCRVGGSNGLTSCAVQCL